MRKLIQPTDIVENQIKLIGEDWMLISAGDSSDFNTMTASWGGVGFLWNKPVVFVFIRPTRYTYEFVEQRDSFTLSFFDESYRGALRTLGTKSGRDGDKIALSGLTPEFLESGNPTFKEAKLVLECKKLYSDMLKEELFMDKEDMKLWYNEVKGGLHKVYVARITSVYSL